MLRIRILLLATVAVLALSAATATAAQATEGPFYKLVGKRLEAGESREMKGSAASAMQLKGSGVTLKCSSLTFAKGAKLIGSTGANPGKSEETIEYEGCTAEGNGEACKVKGNRIATNALKTELGYATKARAGKVLVLLEPASGNALATVKFEGSCTVSETILTGTAIGEAFSGKKVVEIGKEPAEALTGEVIFPATAIEEGWFETGGEIVAKKAKVEGFGAPVNYGGGLILGLSEKNWGLGS